MNPQKQLYRLLAENAQQGRGAAAIHKSAMQQVPGQRQAVQTELVGLRARIQSVGIGNDVEAEERYLELLRHQRRLEQLGAINADVLNPMTTEPGTALQKALDWGNLLLSVYGGGMLVKSAAGDISTAILRLRGLGDERAATLATKLEALCNNIHS
jgi:hypothetical protein